MSNSTPRTLLRRIAARLSATLNHAFVRCTLERRHSAPPDSSRGDGVEGTIIQAARRKWQAYVGTAIDPDETMTRAHPDGVQVRAWLLLHHDEIPNSVNSAGSFLDGLPFKTVEIFLLSQRDGLTYLQIADRLRISHRQVRRHMRRAIAHIAGRT